MATTNTLQSFLPITPNFYAQPVLAESAGVCLTGAAMPNGKGCLVWINGSEVHYAVTSSPLKWLENNIVPAGDIGVLVSLPGEGVRRTSVWCIGDELCATVVTFSGSICTTKIYKADDANNPSSWSVLVVLQEALTPGARFGMEVWGAGIPIRLDSGRLVMVSGVWQWGTTPSTDASGGNSAAWTSDGGAAGPWTVRMQEGHPATFNRINFAASQVARDPETGYLWWCTGSGAGGTINLYMHESRDEGTTWIKNAVPANFFAGHHIQTCIDNGEDIFAISQTPNVLIGSGNLANSAFSGGGWASTGQQLTSFGESAWDEGNCKVIIASQVAYVFWHDRVMRLGGGGGWVIGQAGMG